jgi:hypothetical protein
MHSLKTTMMLASAGALSALLAACSGGSSNLSPAISKSSQGGQAVNRAAVGGLSSRTIGPFASAPLNEQFARTLQVNMPAGVPVIGNAATCTAYLYASDYTTGNLDEFCEDQPNARVVTIPRGAGWGLAVEPGKAQLAVGKTGGTISIYNTLPKIAGGRSAVLTLSTPNTNAYGLCWDNSGGLYATNWPQANIDYFDAARVAAGGSATSTLTPKTVTEPYYLACDFDKAESGNKGYLMLGGFALGTPNRDNDVSRFELPSGPDKVVQQLGSYSTGTGFPGGLALKSDDTLIANSQDGTVYDLGNKAPWSAPPKAACTWSFLHPDLFTSIVFDGAQKEIWASDTLFPVNGTYALTIAYPLPTTGGCFSSGESGGPTPMISGETQYLGVAVYPNNGP